MNDDTQQRRRRVLERYNRLAAPFVDRMVDLRMLFTRPIVTAGNGECYEWTNEAAKRLYESYEETLRMLLETCANGEAMPLLPIHPPMSASIRCSDCAPEYTCWAVGVACRKLPLR